MPGQRFRWITYSILLGEGVAIRFLEDQQWT
jgi:hypothetical protein